MASLNDVKNKIAGVKKTKQITKAMNMVAASKLRGTQTRMESFRPYATKFSEVLGSLAERADEDASPLLIARDTVKSVNVVLCTSDRGLCGGFNSNLLSRAGAFVKDLLAENPDVKIAFTNFGKKGRDWCRKEKCEIQKEYLGIIGGKFDFSIASSSGQQLIEEFLNGTYDEVYVIYSRFEGMGKQIPDIQQILPIPPIESSEANKEEPASFVAEHICEPSAEQVLGDMLPKNVFVQLYSAILETSTSEHAARMLAMDNATKACNDMIDNLTLAYNKARQAAVTTELMDIVGGAEALKG
ncbi:F0F1 ATP synthase subunit gamma [Candidatus Magnetomorum sp. HK-1]|nr:F0F1 ATP synthase subunit gamma [Candidatus Magnetomorum sp. HK-1]